MTIEALPELADLVLVVASSAQRRVAIERQHTLWSRGKEIEDYYKQHEELSAGPWAEEHRGLHWVLVKRDDVEGQVYSSCETYCRQAFNRAAGSSTVENGYIYAISSVFTAAEHRKRGYASHMLRLLHLRLAPPENYADLEPPFNIPPPPLAPDVAEAIPRATASILWSDVGSTFYGKVTIPSPGGGRPGWLVPQRLGNSAIRWKPSKPAPTEQTWSWIYYHNLDDVAKAVSADVKAELEDRPVNDQTSVTTADPASSGLFKFLLEKARHKDNLTEPYTAPVGARIPTGGADTIVIFAPRFFATSELCLALIHNAANLDAVLPVLSAALEQTGCNEVVAWGLENPLSTAFLERGASEEQRTEINGHLLGIATYPAGNWKLENGQAIMWS